MASGVPVAPSLGVSAGGLVVSCVVGSVVISSKLIGGGVVALVIRVDVSWSAWRLYVRSFVATW